MEFPGGLQTKEDVTVSHISDSDLVASSTDILSVGTDVMHASVAHAADFHQLYNCGVLCLQYPPGIPWLPTYSLTTLYKGTQYQTF